MDKNKISCNNAIKFAKNKLRDAQLRHLDTTLAVIDKKIYTLIRKRFVTNRKINDLKHHSSVTTKIYFLIVINKIQLFLIKNSLNFYRQEKKSLSKKIFCLIYFP
jgi:hypothetical protein